ncbi:MAG TPA: altronate dehydratase family protein [Polyangiaceae bacterium]|nr:altronate dehydratase family protein [Polyangiaceae bacterium]
MTRLLLIHGDDSVAVATTELEPGSSVEVDGQAITVVSAVPAGHKVARRAHGAGEPVIKYGWPIGRASVAIAPGEHVHVHNLHTTLSGEASITFLPSAPRSAAPFSRTFSGFRRTDGRVGTRNELWIIPTVGCVARTAEALATRFRAELARFPNVDGVQAFSHAFGCSQLGDDLANTQKILAGLATHPNVGGALVLGLGCENNYLDAFRPFLEGADATRLRFLSAQASLDEHEEGLLLLEQLAERANRDERREFSARELVVGLKCGGSDGLSGITANPLLGRFAERLVASGGTAILTEVPEMFGAEPAFFSRCVDERVFERAVALVSGFRRYYVERGQPVYENPSPGNKTGGISTLEEKSLGCVQKGGGAPITDVVAYGGRASEPGLTLLQGPGNDQVSTTALVAAGATLVLFTTGRGTPLGSPVPTLKVSTNSALFVKKPGWIDFDAGVIAAGAERDVVDAAFAELVFDVANGKPTRNEEHGQRDIAIFKDGVTL